MKQWFREFKVFPGILNSGEAELEENMKFLPALLREHGWPGAFDSKAFQAERVRKNSARLAAWHAEAPLRVLKRLEEDKERAVSWAHGLWVKNKYAHMISAEHEWDEAFSV
ncbi:hypothetical protein V2G26_020552 [Clonostachys chloroleuca]